MATPAARLPKMMLAFVVRRCAVALGHPPSPAEFAAWANGGDVHLFGRPITEAEARVVLRHQARLVSARSATAAERYDPDEIEAIAGPNVVRLADIRTRRRP